VNTRFEQLPIEQLVVHPKNVRKDVGIVTDLANSITAQGIMQPLVVAPALESKPFGWETPGVDRHKFTIIAGHRRHAAAQLANLDVLPCVIREDLTTEPQQLEAMLVENTQRTDLTIMEEARGYQALMEFPGYTVKTIAKNVGRSQRLVKERAKLTTLPEGAIAKLENQQMTVEDALIFAEFTALPEATAELLASHGSYNWPYTVRRWREHVQLQAVESATLAHLKSIGAEIVEPVDTYDQTSEYVSAGRFQDFAGWSDEQHVAAGHKAHPSVRTGEAVWILPKADAPVVPEAMPRPETPEETAERLRREELDAGLKIAAHVRREHLKTAIMNPTAKVLEYIRQERISSIAAQLGGPLAVELFNLPETADKAQIREAIKDLTGDQLAALQIISNRNFEEREMERATGWGPTDWGSDYTSKHRGQMVTLFDYTLSDIEREAIEYIAARNAAVEAKRAALKAAAETDDDEDDFEDA
jgi:ParB family chromosome partitioning protein